MADHQASRVYVHNLAFSVTDDQLLSLFSEVGQVTTALVMKRGGDGRSKGCGLVTFANPALAQRAIIELTDREFEGRKILVREDRDAELPVPRERGERGPRAERADRPERAERAPRERAPRAAGEDRSPASPAEPGCSLYIGNLPWTATWKEVKDVFRQAGFEPTYTDVKVGNDGRSRGWGIARFATAATANEAVAATNGAEIGGRTIAVRIDEKA